MRGKRGKGGGEKTEREGILEGVYIGDRSARISGSVRCEEHGFRCGLGPRTGGKGGVTEGQIGRRKGSGESRGWNT